MEVDIRNPWASHLIVQFHISTSLEGPSQMLGHVRIPILHSDKCFEGSKMTVAADSHVVAGKLRNLYAIRGKYIDFCNCSLLEADIEIERLSPQSNANGLQEVQPSKQVSKLPLP